MADRLSGALRPSDFVARHGGDQFIFGLPGCSRADAEGVAERVRAVSVRRRLCCRTIQEGITTGVAVFPDDGQPAGVTVIADRALFHFTSGRIAA